MTNGSRRGTRSAACIVLQVGRRGYSVLLWHQWVKFIADVGLYSLFRLCLRCLSPLPTPASGFLCSIMSIENAQIHNTRTHRYTTQGRTDTRHSVRPFAHCQTWRLAYAPHPHTLCPRRPYSNGRRRGPLIPIHGAVVVTLGLSVACWSLSPLLATGTWSARICGTTWEEDGPKPSRQPPPRPPPRTKLLRIQTLRKRVTRRPRYHHPHHPHQHLLLPHHHLCQPPPLAFLASPSSTHSREWAS
jgi:hypothetical protein